MSTAELAPEADYVDAGDSVLPLQIPNNDPECDAAVRALEVVWEKQKGEGAGRGVF